MFLLYRIDLCDAVVKLQLFNWLPPTDITTTGVAEAVSTVSQQLEAVARNMLKGCKAGSITKYDNIVDVASAKECFRKGKIIVLLFFLLFHNNNN